MSIEEAVLTRLRELPAEKQQKVLDFAEFLHARHDQTTAAQPERLVGGPGDQHYRGGHRRSTPGDVGNFPRADISSPRW
jgi:hypothetical protein